MADALTRGFSAVTYTLLALAVLVVLAALWALLSRRDERPATAAIPGMPSTRTRGVITKVTEIRTESIQVQDPHTGQVTTYGSLDEMPPDIRAKIEQARASAGPMVGASHTKIVFKDASGTTHTYDSPEQMPPDIRVIYERALKERPPS